jgi:uncharacterized protein YxeA
MTSQIHTAARTVLMTVALSVAALSLPAFAGGNDDESLLIKKEEYKCQSVEKAARSLKKWGYKHIEYEGDKKEYLYVFSADKKKHGEYISWYIVYDACDREIIDRSPAKKEEEQKM